MSNAGEKSAEARNAILRSIREALPMDTANVEQLYSLIRREYRREGNLGRADCIALFLDRLVDYDAEILQVEEESGIADAIAQALSVRGETRLLAAEAFPAHWLPASVQVVRDSPFTPARSAAESAVVTTCEAAVASTGTIVLVHEGAQGRRVLTLLPDHHICLVRRDQIVESLPEAFAAIAPNKAKPMTTISGPSATSDIEMTRIRGVHGPRKLTVILYGVSTD